MRKLQEFLKQYDALAVALSGGRDSALLLREAVAAIGANNVLAITAKPLCMPAHRVRMAKRIAELADVEHVLVQTEGPYDFTMSRGELCKECRKTIQKQILDEAWVRGCQHVIDGATLHGAEKGEGSEAHSLMISPFIVCEIGQLQHTDLYRDTVAPLPGDGCLFRRIPEGMPIRMELIERIDEAEDALRVHGFDMVQVQYDHRCDQANIVWPAGSKPMDEKDQAYIRQVMEDAGFSRVGMK